jgi:AraC family transcriptional activator of pobA
MKKIPVRHIKIPPTKEAPVSDGFSIRDVARLLDGKDMVQELHRHDFFYILALKKGAGLHEIDFTSYKVRDHAVFVMRPGQVHQHTLKAGSTGFLVEFRTDFYHPTDKASAQPLRKATATNFQLLDAKSFDKVFSLLTYIFEEFTNQQEGHREVIKATLGILFIELVRQNTAPTNRNNTYAQERLEDFLELLETDIGSHKQAAHYAGKLNLSPYQLNAIMKATLGKTCSELINEHIILESKRYLLATSNQVNQIAYHLGYEDVSYFIRFFKKHTGYSPEAFRNHFG